MVHAYAALLIFALILGAGCVAIQYNEEYCGDENRLKLRVERDRCFYTLAILKKDPAMCEKIYTGSLGALFDVTSNKIKAECFKEVAIAQAEEYKKTGAGSPTAMAAICQRISGMSQLGVGAESGNPSFRDGCFYEVAVITRTKGLCNEISDIMVDSEEIVNAATGEKKLVQKPLKEVCTEEVDALIGA